MDGQRNESKIGQKMPNPRGTYRRVVGVGFVDDENVYDDEDENGAEGVEDEEEDEEEEEEEDEEEEDIQQSGDDDGADNQGESNSEEVEYGGVGEGGECESRPRHAKLKSLMSSSYGTGAGIIVNRPAATSYSKSLLAGHNSLADWSEQETLVLLDGWGDRFVKHGRKSLRTEEWEEVAEMVSKGSKYERSDAQCRNRIDTLKKKYKKEKMKWSGGGCSSQWIYFKKMEMLMESSLRTPKMEWEKRGSGGRVEMRVQKWECKNTCGKRKVKSREEWGRGGAASSVGLIADSVHNFSKIYEKMEKRKGKRMVELERMRMDVQREVETQKLQMLEKVRCEMWEED